MARKTADDLVDQIAGLAEDIKKLAIAETRKYVALSIEEQFLGTKTASRRTFGGQTPDECILDEAMTTMPSLQDPRLQAAFQRFEDDGPSDDFRAGILFAVRLFADPGYEY